MRTVPSYLNDRLVTGDEPSTDLFDAYTGQAIARVSTRGLDLRSALEHARRVGGPNLRKLTFTQRGELLKKLSDVLHANRDELIELARQNSGNTRSDAKFDIDGASGTLAYYAALGKKLGDRTFLLDGPAEPILRSPRFVGQHVLLPKGGVAIHINAFNFPAWGLGEKAAVALLSGVPILAKPATATALVTSRIVELWAAAGVLPAGAVSLLAGSAGDLLDHVGPQDVIAFTGSGDTGRTIRTHRQVVAHNVPVAVEADSLNAAILGPDVEAGSDTFQMFVTDVARDITQKAGQKCTAIRRILVPEALLEAATEALVDRLSQAVMGDPDQRATTVGPLATRSQQQDVLIGIETLGKHAKAVFTASGTPETGYFVAPRLFQADGGVDAAFVHDHEVFGPVATLLPWPGEAAEAVDIVARAGGCLVTSLYSDDVDWAREVVLGIAPWNGRIQWGSKKVHDQGAGPGTVLPGFVHGGPGKAGGGEELGAERGMRFYFQRTAIQADRALLERALGGLGSQVS
jgi:3,4-dehydroadipyl-CoA semialdehyde dehydrogenase